MRCTDGESIDNKSGEVTGSFCQEENIDCVTIFNTTTPYWH